jgi:hypothetical protein
MYVLFSAKNQMHSYKSISFTGRNPSKDNNVDSGITSASSQLLTFSIGKLIYVLYIYTVKPAHEVTFIKQSPVLKGHFFLVLS